MAFDRAAALALIKRNIEKSGFHIYLIGGDDQTPRFAYTIGLRESLGAELVLAGATNYTGSDVMHIMHSLREQLAKDMQRTGIANWHGTVDVRSSLLKLRLGSFTFRKAHSSWTCSLLLGALDYYGLKHKHQELDVYQIVPDETHRTNDVPNMANEWSASLEPIWRHLHE